MYEDVEYGGRKWKHLLAMIKTMINTESFYKKGIGVKKMFTYSIVFTKQPK